MHIRLIALALLFTTACASTPGAVGAQEATKKPIRGGIAEFHPTLYNTKTLEGRLLIGATVDPFVVGSMLLPGRTVELEKVRACGKTEPLEHLMADMWIFRESEPRITLRPGYWYGGDVSFVGLFMERQTGLGPDCLEANLLVFATGYNLVATLPIRVERTDKPPAAPKPPCAKGGAP